MRDHLVSLCKEISKEGVMKLVDMVKNLSIESLESLWGEFAKIECQKKKFQILWNYFVEETFPNGGQKVGGRLQNLKF